MGFNGIREAVGEDDGDRIRWESDDEDGWMRAE